jgi:hypothetical protein
MAIYPLAQSQISLSYLYLFVLNIKANRYGYQIVPDAKTDSARRKTTSVGKPMKSTGRSKESKLTDRRIE